MPRSQYHHGDLPRALVAEGLELARYGGPDAVTLREAARRLEVSPAAIYRHFPDREALLGEVSRTVRRDLALRMLAEVDKVEEPDAPLRAIQRFLAVGRGYLSFAAEAPNLIAVAFLPIEPTDGVAESPNPWHVLAAALDELVASGAMPPERRSGAEIIAWSAVHGFAVLRAGHSFDVSREPDPDAEALLEAIARSLDLRTVS
jgi:AcrR family transcriptional regulator